MRKREHKRIRGSLARSHSRWRRRGRPLFELLEARLPMAASPPLDPVFDGSGQVLTDIQSNDFGQDVALQSDGKLIVVGTSAVGNMLAVRYNDDGSLDTTFATGGVADIDFGGVDGAFRVVVDDSDRIVIGGFSSLSGTDDGNDFAVARLNKNGSLDTTFADDGRQTLDFGNNDIRDVVYGMAIDYTIDGTPRILLAGESHQTGPSQNDIAVARLLDDGTPDASFGIAGQLLVDINNTIDDGRSVAVDSQGRIVVSGVVAQPSTDRDMAVVRLDENGLLDASFDSDGKQTINFGGWDFGLDLAIDSQDRPVVGGWTALGGTIGLEFSVARLTEMGHLDNTFSTDGKQLIDFGSTDEIGRAVAVDSKDRVLIAGQTRQSGTGYDFGLARLTSNGELDTTFDLDGKVTVDFGLVDDQANGLAVDENERILLAGYSTQVGTQADFAVARLFGSPAPIAYDDFAATTEDVSIDALNLIANDIDPDLDDLAIHTVDLTGTLGTVLINPEGDSVVYDPSGRYYGLAAGETATDSFLYEVLDGSPPLLETASGSLTNNGHSVSDIFWQMHRFEVSESTRITSVGAMFRGGLQTDRVFGGLVRLTGPADVPDSFDLSTDDLLATTVITVGPEAGDYSGLLDRTLPAGWYGIVFGAGEFGADTDVSRWLAFVDTDLAPSQNQVGIRQASSPLGEAFINQSASARNLIHSGDTAAVTLNIEGVGCGLTVVNTNDGGIGSFRDAIICANSNPGQDSIEFAIPGVGPHTIQPLSPLPPITDPVIIDGYSQAGASPNTNLPGLGLNSVVMVEIDGTNAGSGSGIRIVAPDTTVSGLAINRFSQHGIDIVNNGTAEITGNFIGTDIAGQTSLPNGGQGVRIFRSARNVIGGPTPAARNLISGNLQEGVGISGIGDAPGTRVENNLIGTDVTGTSAIGNRSGITVVGAKESVLSGNVVSGNSKIGILLSNPSTNANAIERNMIGSDVSGNIQVGNGIGVMIAGGAVGNSIGGTPAAGNFIAFNDGGSGLGGDGAGIVIENSSGTLVSHNTIHANSAVGVAIKGSSSALSANQLSGNSVYENGGLGIDLGFDGVTANDPDDTDTGANHLQNFPQLNRVVTYGGSTFIEGSLHSAADASFTVELFATPERDPSGHGEGQLFLASELLTTDVDGNAILSLFVPIEVPVGHFVTATATDSFGNTSEFSEAIVVTANRAPVLADLIIEGDPVQEGGTVHVSGSFTDPDLADRHKVVVDFGSAVFVNELPVGERAFSVSYRFPDDVPSGTDSDTVAVSVVLSDGVGGEDSETASVTVLNASPVITAQEDEELAGFEWASLSREITFVDPGVLDQHEMTIDYGDGSPIEVVSIQSPERGFILEHAYAVTPNATANYVVSISVADDDASQDSVSFNVGVTDKGLTEPDLRPIVQFAETGYVATEGEPFVTVKAILSSPARQRLVVPATLVDNTAAHTVDFSVNTNFVFQTGQREAEVRFSAIDDSIYEPVNETATLSFSSQLSEVRVGLKSEATLTVVSDDLLPAVYFKESTSIHQEGDTYQLTVELTEVTDETVTVPLRAFPGSATSADYSLSETQVTIPAGERNASVTLSVTDDPRAERDESFQIEIVNPVTGAELRAEPGKSTRHTARIVANDTFRVDLTTSVVSVSEGDGTFDLVLTLDGPAATSYTVPISLSPRNACSGDCKAPSTITIPAGESSVSREVTIIDDEIGEETEEVTFALGSPLPAGLRRGRNTVAVVEFVDDDVANIEFNTRKTHFLYEDQGSFGLTVRTGGVTFDRPINIPFSVRSLTAGGKYNGDSADLEGPTEDFVTIPAGQTSTRIELFPKDDRHNEKSESFEFRIGSVSSIPGAQHGARLTRRVTIWDDDPLVTISDGTTRVSEGNKEVDFTVKLSAKTNETVRVPFQVYGSATRDKDYSIVEETTKSKYTVGENYIDIKVGQSQGVVTVKVKEDELFELTERVGIKLVKEYKSFKLSNALLGSRKSDSFDIKNDDGVPIPVISEVRGRQPGSKSYSSKSSWIDEGGFFRITISLANPAFRSVFVPITYPSGKGRASSNDFTTYGLKTGLLKIPSGTTSADFTIETTNDSHVEGDEKIRVTMGQPIDFKGNKFGKLPKDNYQFLGILDDDDSTPCAYGSLTPGCSVGADPDASLADDSSLSTDSTIRLPPGTSFVGLSMSGYRVGSNIFLDGNLNGVRDFLDFDADGIQAVGEPEEPLAVSDPDGSFLMHVPTEFDRNGDGTLNWDEGQLVSVGGIDLSTGQPITSRLIATPGDYVLTALTTVAAKLVQQHDYSLEDAHQRVLDSLSLPVFDIGSTAVPFATLAGDLSAAASYPSTTAVENTVIVIAHYFDGVTGSGVELLSDLVYERVAQIVSVPEAFVDLSNPGFLENLAVDVGSLLGFGEFTSNTAALSQALGAINSEILSLPIATELAFLEEVVRRKIVARGELAANAQGLGAGTISDTELASRYSGQSLQDRIAAAQPGTIEPVRIAALDAEIVEGDDGLSYLEFPVQVSEHFSAPLSVQYRTIPDTAQDESAGSLADYLSVEGILQWEVGDAPLKSIQVPVFGDVLPELDESFQLEIFNESAGIIQDAVGRATIFADDPVVVELPNRVEPSEATLLVEGDTVVLTQDGQLLLEGSLHENVPLIVRTGDGGQTNVDVEVLAPPTTPRGIRVQSNGSSDRVHLTNGDASFSEHIVEGSESGRFFSDGVELVYLDFGQVSDERTAVLQLDGEPVLGTSLFVSADFVEYLDSEGAALTWTAVLDEEIVAIQMSDDFEFTPTLSGTYELELQAEFVDGSTSVTRQTLTVREPNAPPQADAGGPYEVVEGGTVRLSASATTDPDLPSDVLTYVWDLDGDQIYGETGLSAERGDELGIAPQFNAAGVDGPSRVTVYLQVTDRHGLMDTATATVDVSNAAPVVKPISAPVEPHAVNTLVSVRADFSDLGSADTHTALWDWGDGTTSPGTVVEENGVGSVVDEHAYTVPGVYTVVLTVTDDDGASSAQTFQYIVVYDPTAGFVTGGGWIDSPAGAYVADPSLSGTASFGFVSKYKKGQSVPDGQTQFQFQAGDLHFKSTAYDWLVIAGANAKFKGSGRINGAGHFGFMLTATDGQASGGDGTDKFRIKIWDKDHGDTLVYDNQPTEAEDSDAGTKLAGGSIVLHGGKGHSKSGSQSELASLGSVFPTSAAETLSRDSFVNTRLTNLDVIAKLEADAYDQGSLPATVGGSEPSRQPADSSTTVSLLRSRAPVLKQSPTLDAQPFRDLPHDSDEGWEWAGAVDAIFAELSRL